MALKVIMLRRELDTKRSELEALTEKDGAFSVRESELETAINEAETKEERDAVAAEVDSYEEEKAAHDAAMESLRAEIAELESALEAEENKVPPVVEERKAEPIKTAENHTNIERGNNVTMENINIRSLPMNVRAFDALPMERRNAILEQEDVKSFLSELRSMKGETRAISGGELTIPVVMLDLIAENMFRYSKLMNRVRVRNVAGTARQTIAGTVPEAVWTEMCANINELTFVFNQITLDGYKVAGYIPVCNGLLEDNDVNLASWIVEMISESIGLAKDKAILYGKGSSYHQPLGIVTRLAQQSQPAGYPAAAPAWTDLHSTNIISINSALSGAAFWSALTIAASKAFTKYARGTQFWAMNSKTYALLKSKVITFTASGDIAANVFGTLPIINGDIDILEFMPDNNIVGGYGDLYLWAQRSGMTIESSRECQFIQDNTVFRGKERADGAPVIPGAFVAIDIAGNSPVTEMAFAGDTANTVSGLLLNTATLAITGTGTTTIEAVPLPYGVKVSDADVSWVSGTTGKATITSTGVVATVTGVSSGTSKITSTCNGFTAEAIVTVS